MLTVYEFFALRPLGRSKIPYRVAALAAFTSSAVDHNAGATASRAASNSRDRRWVRENPAPLLRF
jgi:hypothetical protein